MQQEYQEVDFDSLYNKIIVMAVFVQQNTVISYIACNNPNTRSR